MKAHVAREPALLQRACACGKGATVGGECADCKRAREQGAAPLLRSPAPRPGAPPPSPGARDFSGVPVANRVAAERRPRLAIGPVDDPLEREADRVSADVAASADLARHSPRNPVLSRRLAGRLQRQADELDDEDDDEVDEEFEERPAVVRGLMQAKSTGRTPAHAPPAVERYVDRLSQSGGERLPATTRTELEPRLGHDLASVRVHRDAPAAQAAHGVGARAFTVGRHVVFGAGQYAPESSSGRRLLAHELTHVAQQSGSGAAALQRAPWGACPPGAHLTGARPDRYGAAELAMAGYYKTTFSSHCVATNLDLFEELDCAGAAGRAFATHFRSGRSPRKQRQVRPTGKVPSLDPDDPVGGVDDFEGHATQEVFALLRPDIIDFTTREMYDVTTTGLAGAKVAKVAGYVKLAETITRRRWSAGRNLPAPGPFLLNFKFRPRESICYGPTDFARRPGVIAYDVIGDEKTKKEDKEKDEERRKKREEKKRKKEEAKKKREEKKREKERAKKEREHAKKEGKKKPKKTKEPKPKKEAKKPKETKPKEEKKKPAAPEGGGANIGFGISLGGGGGAGNAGVGVSIMSNGQAYGTVGAGVVYDSDGVAVGAAGAGVSSGSTAYGAGTAGAGLSKDSTSVAAGTAGAGSSEGSTTAGAGVAGAGTSKDDLTAGAGIAAKGDSEGQVGAAAGRTGTTTPQGQTGGTKGGTSTEGGTERHGEGEKEGTGTQPGGTKAGTKGATTPGTTGSDRAGSTGTGTGTGTSTQTTGGTAGGGTGAVGSPGKHGLSIPGQAPGKVDKAVEDAARIEEMIRKARPQQRALMDYLAKVSGDDQYVVPGSTWVTTILQATDGVKDEDLAYLITLQWQPGKVTPDELKRNVEAALKRRRAGEAPGLPADPAKQTPTKKPPSPKPDVKAGTIDPHHGKKVEAATKQPPGAKPKKPAPQVGGAGPAQKDDKPESQDEFIKRLAKRAADYPSWSSLQVGEVLYSDKKPFPQSMVVYYKLQDKGGEAHVTFDVWGSVEKRGKGSVLKVISSSSIVTSEGKFTAANILHNQELPLQ